MILELSNKLLSVGNMSSNVSNRKHKYYNESDFAERKNQMLGIPFSDRNKGSREISQISCQRGGAREYDLPTSDTLGAIVFESGPDTRMNYDVIIEPKDGFPRRISRLHKSYMSLQFPLLFVYGQSGYYSEMKQRDDDDKRISMNNYYMYQLHERSGLYGLLFRGGRLFHQYVVGVYCSIEQNRIDYYRTHQNDIRKDYLSGVYDALHIGDRVGSDIGGKFILPRTFTGGPRFVYYRIPETWLPHCHMLLWVKQKIEDAQEVDEYISAELPNPEEDPEGYKVVSEMMVHGLCGLINEDAVMFIIGEERIMSTLLEGVLI
ncbi:DNA helicase [Tanacetum coccineum]